MCAGFRFSGDDGGSCGLKDYSMLQAMYSISFGASSGIAECPGGKSSKPIKLNRRIRISAKENRCISKVVNLRTYLYTYSDWICPCQSRQ